MPKGKRTSVYSARAIRALRGKTDWPKVDKLSDEDIALAVASDSDAAPIDIDWTDAAVLPPRKQLISIRIDLDVLAFFKNSGAGYQRRMNSVLRHFMTEQRKKKKG